MFLATISMKTLSSSQVRLLQSRISMEFSWQSYACNLKPKVYSSLLNAELHVNSLVYKYIYF